MYKKRGFIFFLFFLYLGKISAQHITISGYVEDLSSGEKLIGANVYEPVRQVGTVTNSFGFFSLKIPDYTQELFFSYVGYEKKIVKLAGNDSSLTIQLAPLAELDEIVVYGEEIVPIENRTSMSRITVPVSQIKKAPALLGEADVLKTITLLPGVQSGSEGSAGMYVRGGSPDHNLILLDGVPVYNASHLFGFLSVFNSDAIKNVTLHKGGFPARFGGRLSSVLEIDLKDGNKNEFHGSAALGIVSGRLMLEGPIGKKTSYMISARRSLIDIVAKPLIESENTDDNKAFGGYYFYDLTAKVNHTFSSKSRLFLSLYTGKDRFYSNTFNRYTYDDPGNIKEISTNESNFDLNWGNITSALRWNYVINNQLFSNTTLTFSEYGFTIFADSEDKNVLKVPQKPDSLNRSYYNLNNRSGVRDIALKIDFDYLPNPNHTIRFGTSATLHRYSPEATQIVDQSTEMKTDTTINFELAPTLYAQEMDAYIEDEIELSDSFSLNIGLRGSVYQSRGDTYYSIEPRASFRMLLPYSVALKGGYSYMRQYVHLLTNVSISLPTDLWIPSGEGIRPEEAHQVGIGLAKSVGDGVELSFESYMKWMNNLIEYKEGAQFLGSNSTLGSQIESGGFGRSYGFEFLVQKTTGNTTGWIGYTLSWADRRFDAFNQGKRYPYKYDRRHDFSVIVSHQLKKGIDVSAVWVFSSGLNLTLPQKKYDNPNNYLPGNNYYQSPWVYTYEGRNSYRMENYHRLDLSIDFKKKKKYGMRTWSMGFYNTYSRLNPFFIYVDPGFEGSAVKQVSIFPIIPFLSYQYEF